MAEEYKIRIGTELDTSDLKPDIAKLDNKYKIDLGVHVKTSEIREQISKYNQNSNNAKLKLGIKLDTTGLKTQIDKIDLNGSGKNTKGVSIPVNTATLEASLREVKDIIADIKNSLGSLGSGNTKSLLSSINQIADSLGRATNESETLIKTLNSISKKDFNVNIGLNLGNNNNPVGRNVAYGNKVRSETLPQLKQQVEALVKYYNDSFKTSLNDVQVLQKLTEKTKLSNDFFNNFLFGNNNVVSRMGGSGSLSSQMQAFKEYINMYKEAAALKGFKIDGVTSTFSKTAEDVVKEAQDIQTGVKNAVENTEEQFKKFKGLFGGGIDSESLSQILNDLKEIKTSLQSLAGNNTIDSLTQSFNTLSQTLDKLIANAGNIKVVLDNSFDGVKSDAEQATKAVEQTGQAINRVVKNVDVSSGNGGLKEAFDEIGELENTLLNFKNSLKSVGFDNTFEDFKISTKGMSGTLDDNGLTLTIKGIDEAKEAVTVVSKLNREAEEGEQLKFKITVDDSKVNSALDKIKNKLKESTSGAGDSDYHKQISQLENSFGRLTNQSDDLRDRISNLKVILGQMYETDDAQKLITLNEQLEQSLKNVGNQIKIDANDSSVNVIKEINKEMTNFVKLQKEIGQKQIDIEVAKSQGGSVEYIEALERELKGLESTYDSLIQTFMKKITVNADMVSFEELTKFDDKIESINRSTEHKIGKIVDESNAKTLRELNSEFSNFVKLQSKIGDMQVKIKKLELAGDNETRIAELKRQLEDLENTYAKLMQTFMKKLIVNADVIEVNGLGDEIEAEMEKAKNKINELEAAFSDTQNKLAKGIELKVSDNGIYTKQVEDLRRELDSLPQATNESRLAVNQLEQALKDMQNAANNDERIKAEERYQSTLQQTKVVLDRNKQSNQDFIDSEKLKQNARTLSLDMGNWLSDNSAAAKQFGDRIRSLQAELKSCDSVRFNGIKDEFKEIKAEVKSLGLATQTLGDKFKTQFQKYSAYLGVAEIMMYAEQGLRDMFEQVKLIDSAMTELKKVTDETDATYSKFLENAAERAKKIGTTIDGLVESTAEFAKIGYSFEDSQGLAEVANIYKLVGDNIESAEEATQSLISTMAAFKDEMGNMSNTDFAMSIVDKFNEVDLLLAS